MFGPYDKKFDKNKNGIMEDDEKLEEQAYIRYLAEKDDEGEEDDDFDNNYVRDFHQDHYLL